MAGERASEHVQLLAARHRRQPGQDAARRQAEGGVVLADLGFDLAVARPMIAMR
jgi:hypothetical protein